MNTPLFLIILAMMIVTGTALEPGTQNVTFPNRETNLVEVGLRGPGFGLIIACTIGSVVCLLFVWNRIHWRIRLSGGLGFDDWAICIALFFLIVQSVFASLAVTYGYGTESIWVERPDVERALIFFYIFQIVYKCTINMVKVSILSLYIRVFHPYWARLTSVILLITTLVAMLAFLFVTMFQCVPVKCTFKPWEVPEGSTRINVGAFWKANALWNISSDILILILPVFMVRGMHHLSIGQRINLSLMFLLGVIVMVAAILRYTTLGSAAAGNQDILNASYRSTVWTEVESTLAVACACLPMLRQFFGWLTTPLNTQSAATGGWVMMQDQVNSGLPAGAVMQPIPVERIGRAL